MSCLPFDAANFSDDDDDIFYLLTLDSAIVTSRKRKLRELFAVATQTQPLPQQAYALSDAPAATTAEWQFLQTNDILQYVSPIKSSFLALFGDCFAASGEFLLFHSVSQCRCSIRYNIHCILSAALLLIHYQEKGNSMNIASHHDHHNLLKH